jgi:hypothetical protein
MLLTTFALACGGGAEPPSDVGAAGLWDATMTATRGLQPPLVTCTIPWVMNIEDLGNPGAPALFTTVPVGARISCEDGFAGPWTYAGATFYVHEAGSEVAILNGALDTFVVATISGTSMTGRVGEFYYLDSHFRATRRSGADPNAGPVTFKVGIQYLDMEIAETLRAGSLIQDGYGRTVDTLAVAWTSRSSAYVTVDPDGLLHGVSPGTAWIVGQVAGLRDSFEMTVLPPAASVEFTTAPDSLIVPHGDQFLAVAKDAGGQPMPDRRLTWETSNPAIATVDATGYLTPVAPGTVTVTVHSTVVSASRSVPVLPAVAAVTLSSPSTTVAIGGTLQVTATTKDAQGNVLTGRPVHWEADSDGQVITVDQTGLVTGVAPGTATLSATAEDVTAELEVTVE